MCSTLRRQPGDRLAGAVRKPRAAPAPRLVAVLAAIGVAAAFAAPEARCETPLAPQPLTVEQRMRQDLTYLAADDREGRGVGTDGLRQAAQHIAGSFARAGLNTSLFQGQPLQTVEVDLGATAGPAEQNWLRVQQPDQPLLTAGLDDRMRPLALGASGQASGPLVFAGYGIAAPQLGYDDYAGIDVEGAVVIILRKLPGGGQGPLSDRAHQSHAYFSTKIRTAADKGARAVLLVNDRRSVDDAIRQLRRRHAAESHRAEALQNSIDQTPTDLQQVRETFRRSLESSHAQLRALETELQQAEHGLLGIAEAASPDGPASIPVASLSRVTASQLLTAAGGLSLEAWEEQVAQTMQPNSRRLADTTAELSTAVHTAAAQASNVVAEFPGAGALADQTVIVGAHYDHVGMGGYGSLAPGTVAVHNGADDNASGTTVLLELARRLEDRLGDAPSRRRIVLIAFTAEERGLLGSAHYVRQPRFPLHSTVAMINLDMVGRLRDNELTVYGSGTAAEFDTLLDQVNEQARFHLVRVPSGYGPSDHQSFYEREIPVLFFFTGLHNDYHRPTDDSDKIDLGGMTRITDMVTDVVTHLALAAQRPTYQSTERTVEIRRQLTAYLGISMTDAGGRLVIGEVVAGSPAEHSGLRVGDVISEMMGKPVDSIDDVRGAVRARNPGDLVTMTVRREGRSITVRVILAQRP